MLNSAEHEFLRHELSESAIRWLKPLSSRQREVVVLRWREQLSHAAIAQRLNISREIVVMHLEQAIEHLQKTMPETFDFE